MKSAWRRWLKFSEVLGTFQMMVVLSLVYWTMLPIIAVPFKLFADPLVLRRPSRARWVERVSASQTIEAMQKQY